MINVSSKKLAALFISLSKGPLIDFPVRTNTFLYIRWSYTLPFIIRTTHLFKFYLLHLLFLNQPDWFSRHTSYYVFSNYFSCFKTILTTRTTDFCGKRCFFTTRHINSCGTHCLWTTAWLIIKKQTVFHDPSHLFPHQKVHVHDPHIDNAAHAAFSWPARFISASKTACSLPPHWFMLHTMLFHDQQDLFPSF